MVNVCYFSPQKSLCRIDQYNMLFDSTKVLFSLFCLSLCCLFSIASSPHVREMFKEVDKFLQKKNTNRNPNRDKMSLMLVFLLWKKNVNKATKK